MNKLLSLTLSLLLVMTPRGYSAQKELVAVKEFKGLNRTSNPDRIADGEHTKFDNVYIKDGNITSVKGRNRLNSSALSNTTTNGFWYYENTAGSTKKLVRFENTVLASYDIDGTNRTELNTGLTNEKHDGVQIGDTLYITGDTDGLYKWTGSGAATAISGVSAPSAVDFAATTGFGGMTPGLDILITPSIVNDDSCAIPATATAATGCITINGLDLGGDNVTADTGTVEVAHTTTTYTYKVTKYSTVWGIESEPSTADTAALKGDDTFTWAASSCSPCDTESAYGNGSGYNACCSAIEYVTSGKQTRTTGTLASAPSAPFDGYCVYRGPAGSVNLYRVSCERGGGSTYTDGIADAALDGEHPIDDSIDTTNPPSFRYTEEFKGSIFLGQNGDIYFNRLDVQAVTDADTYWLATDKFSTGSKKPITGLHKTSDSLLVFTADRVMELTGFGYSSFKLKPFAEGIGSVSDESIETDTQGDVIFFAGTEGVYKIKTFSQLQDDANGTAITNQARVRLIKLSSPGMDEVFRGTDSQIDLDPADYATSHSYYDRDNELYFLYIGEHCFIFDNAKSVWSHIPATKMGGSVYRKSPSAAGQGVLMDTLGFMYNNWIGYENGIESGSVTGAITASTSTTLTCGACTFNTTNDGLKGLWVGVINDTEGIQYRQITSNTGTALTVSSAWTTNPISSDTFYVAYIIPDILTKVYSFGAPPKTTESKEFWITYVRAAAAQTLYVYSFQNKDADATNALSFDTDTIGADLSLNGVKKFNMPVNNYWIQYGIRTYIYNTSNSINPPLNLISYVVKGSAEQEV